jgi:hypothetical protein
MNNNKRLRSISIQGVSKMEGFYSIVTLRERPDLKADFSELHRAGWKKFMREDPIATGVYIEPNVWLEHHLDKKQ